MTKKVFLWTAPRCVSTAFERSIMEINHSKIFHEPYSRSYYFGPERQSRRYESSPVDLRASYLDTCKKLTKEFDGIEVIFSKDMAYAIENHFDEMLKDELKNFQHTFLIRNPKKTVVSLYKASVNTQLTGWDFFDPVEAGFKQMYDLYQFIVNRLDQQPVIIDADDLLANPAGTMEAYCKVTNLPFDENMLKWEPGPILDWDVWNGWHDSALKSSGFTKHDVQQLENFENLDDYPLEVQSCVKECQVYYEFLRSRKTEPTNT